MDIYSKFIGNFMRAKAAIEIAKQARPVFAKFLEVSLCLTCAVFIANFVRAKAAIEIAKQARPVFAKR